MGPGAHRPSIRDIRDNIRDNIRDGIRDGDDTCYSSSEGRSPSPSSSSSPCAGGGMEVRLVLQEAGAAGAGGRGPGSSLQVTMRVSGAVLVAASPFWARAVEEGGLEGGSGGRGSPPCCVLKLTVRSACVASAVVLHACEGRLECNDLAQLVEMALQADAWGMTACMDAVLHRLLDALLHVQSLKHLGFEQACGVIVPVLKHLYGARDSGLKRHALWSRLVWHVDQFMCAHFGHAQALLQDPAQLAAFCKLSPWMVLKWLELDQLQVDSENTVLVLVAAWALTRCRAPAPQTPPPTPVASTTTQAGGVDAAAVWGARAAQPPPPGGLTQSQALMCILLQRLRVRWLSSSYLMVLDQLPHFPARLRVGLQTVRYARTMAASAQDEADLYRASRDVPPEWLRPPRPMNRWETPTLSWRVSMAEVQGLQARAQGATLAVLQSPQDVYCGGYRWYLQLVMSCLGGGPSAGAGCGCSAAASDTWGLAVQVGARAALPEVRALCPTHVRASCNLMVVSPWSTKYERAQGVATVSEDAQAAGTAAAMEGWAPAPRRPSEPASGISSQTLLEVGPCTAMPPAHLWMADGTLALMATVLVVD